MTERRQRRWPTVACVVWYWLPVVVWMAIILALSGQSDLPARTNPATGEMIRSTTALAKTAHVVEYAALGALMLRAMTAAGGGVGLAHGVAAVWVVLAAAAFGAGDEFRQSFVPNREPRVSDVMIDGVSAFAAVCCLLLCRRTRVVRFLLASATQSA